MDNEDVMGFESEPENINVNNEPDNIPQEAQNDNIVYDDSEDYSDFEAASEEELINENNFTSDSEQNDEENDDENSEEDEDNEEDYEDEPSQQKKILDTEASQKIDITKNKNKGLFLQRGKIITIVIGGAIILFIFFALVVPSLKIKKKKEDNKELDKAGLTVIPNSITREEPYKKENRVDFEDGNSALNNSNEDYDDDFDKKYPPIIEEKNNNVAPVAVPNKGGNNTTSDFPITNRNEQQKQIQRLSLDRNDSSSKSQGNKYGTSVPSGYENYGYNSNRQNNSGYTPQSLTSNVDKFLAQQNGGSSYQDLNNQSGKQEFLNRKGLGGQYQWNSDFSIWKGTVISAVLDTGINTDLPGTVMGHVTKNIYSSQDGKYLLIPQGSRLYGEYNSDVSYGQKRVQVVWNTLIRPDGLEINLGSMNGIDAYGFSGYKGITTNHPFEYVKAFGLIAMYSILDTKANRIVDTQNNAYAQNAVNDVYSETKKLNNKIVDRALDIQPTNIIQSGTEVNLITNVTIDLPPLEAYEVEEKYVLER